MEERALKSPHITLPEFKIICEQHGITHTPSQLNLSQYLHDLGAIVHYQNERDISHWIILDPRWVIDAVYAILADKTVQQH